MITYLIHSEILTRKPTWSLKIWIHAKFWSSGAISEISYPGKNFTKKWYHEISRNYPDFRSKKNTRKKLVFRMTEVGRPIPVTLPCLTWQVFIVTTANLAFFLYFFYKSHLSSYICTNYTNVGWVMHMSLLYNPFNP